jgi:hypothetical protein
MDALLHTALIKTTAVTVLVYYDDDDFKDDNMGCDDKTKNADGRITPL